MIDQYLKSFEVKQCPKKPLRAQIVLAYNAWVTTTYSSYYNTNPKARGTEFGPGAKSCGYERGFVTCEAVSDGEIEDHAATMTVWEHGAAAPACVFLQPPNWYSSPPRTGGYFEHFNFLHRDGAVTIWADTHVRRMGYYQLKRPMFSVRKDIYK